MYIICGHYGSGKTNLTINLALEAASQGKSVTVLDMDIVNPYFRTSDYNHFMAQHGVHTIEPVFANTTLDTPSLPPQMYAAFDKPGEEVFVDVGGDDVGIKALGSMRKQLADKKPEMIYVINQYRVLSQTAEESAVLLREIENSCGLKATAIINNSHLGVETTAQTVLDSFAFAEETAKRCGLPLLYSTIPDFAIGSDFKYKENMNYKIKIIKRYVLFPWEKEPS
ncbi:nucleotide-binding protein [Scatolibacter rhodanostii]|uniref:nucleotide-binding protein n=1 Tax=Scatolibacter rhodanostii TaxID=2014781 RepID=UPI000C08D9D2